MADDPSTESDAAAEPEPISRRGALATIGALGAAGLAAPSVAARPGQGGGPDEQSRGAGPTVSTDVGVVRNPKFITDARGDGLPGGDELVFDTAPVSIPLDRILAVDDTYDSELFASLNDSRQLVVKPPEGYDREDGYDEPWPPLRWADIADTAGTATVGRVGKSPGPSGDAGTRVEIEVENAIPNGQYTVWVVKYAALNERGRERFSADNPFVTPDGQRALVGFHNLGQKFDDPGRSENDFTTDADGNGRISAINEGGPLSGVPGFRPLGEDPVDDGPVPFVGTEDDYEQSGERLDRIQNNLRAEDQIAFVGAYHYDNQTWGVYPGPWHLNQFAAAFVFGD